MPKNYAKTSVFNKYNHLADMIGFFSQTYPQLSWMLFLTFFYDKCQPKHEFRMA